jgi:succinate dehydrogenase / fumarate reductase iron-sulfur subunit
MNVISALMEIQKNPVTDGKKVAPVVWECVCLEEVCGACTMLVNGGAPVVQRAGRSIAPNGETITLEPMTKFPLVRDLVVDRSRMFDDLKKVKAWIQLDGSHELGPGRASRRRTRRGVPAVALHDVRLLPRGVPAGERPSSDFIGPAAINQVRLFNLHPSGKMHAPSGSTRHGRGGIEDCGKAQNCVEVCPKEIPLVDSIAATALGGRFGARRRRSTCSSGGC